MLPAPAGSPRRRRRPRRAVPGVLAAAVAALLVLLLPAVSASAHLAITLVVLSPAEGATTGGDVDMAVLAQPEFQGVDQVAYSLTLDGTQVDPRNGGGLGSVSQVTVHVRETAHILFHGLHPGPHTVVLTYRPDTDEPLAHLAVHFTVAAASPWYRSVGAIVLYAAAAVVLVAAVLLLLWLRRRRRAAPAAS